MSSEIIMEGFLFSIPHATLLLKSVALIILAVAIKLFLKILKISLPVIIHTNKTRYRIQNITSLTLGIIFIILCAVLFSADIKEFAIPFSIIGAGVAFASQELIASIAGRLIIVMTNLYQVGDRIQIGDMQGDVIHIGFARTSLMEIGSWVKADLYTGRIVHVTNALVLKNNVVNYSGAFPFVWDEIIVPVRYGNDQHLARKILLMVATQVVDQYVAIASEKWQAVKKHYMVGTPSFDPAVTLVANDNWMEFTVRYVVPYEKRRATKDQLFLAIVDEFEKTNGKVELASMTIEITNFPKLAVEVSKE